MVSGMGKRINGGGRIREMWRGKTKKGSEEGLASGTGNIVLEGGGKRSWK